MNTGLGITWPDDLAPGDRRESVRAAWGALRLHVVETPEDPWFDTGFRLLREEFGGRGELEPRHVLAERLAWDPRVPTNGCSMLYRMMLVFSGETCVAVRDHTAILAPGSAECVVHLSHALVLPAWRRQGLSGLLRALPLQTARQCANAAGGNGDFVSLVAEMEPWDPTRPAGAVRLTAYERAGFLKVEFGIGYHQPDFRAAAEIDCTGGPRPLPLDLVLRRTRRETERAISGVDLQRLVAALYAMYAVHARPGDMDALLRWSHAIAARGRTYRLFPPTWNGAGPPRSSPH